MKRIIIIMIATFSGLSGLVSCSDKLEILQSYDFSVTTLPVQSKICQGETVEIRCQLVRTGYYERAKYYIRYFQPEGKGSLKLDDGKELQPNDLYQLNRDTFRLYYKSDSSESQTIDLYFEDNFGKVVTLSFSFSNDNRNPVISDQNADKLQTVKNHYHKFY